jgi:Na+-transporting methylmalonyl-CoA/oxaloacetate decarboxylase gamma subunit
MKRFALSMFVLTLLAPQMWVLGASYQDVKGPKDKAEKTKGPQDKTDKEKAKTVPVPEPATITLLAAGAGAAMARKLWQKRQQR